MTNVIPEPACSTGGADHGYNAHMNTFYRGVLGSNSRKPGTAAPAALLMVVILSLSSCGGDPAETVASPAEAGPTSTVAIFSEAAEPQQPVAVAPTDEPPTAALEPTVEPIIAPTLEPEGASLPEGLCANPYFPVIEGARYTYQTETPAAGPTTYSFTFSNVTPTSFDMVLGDTETALVTYTWQCLEEGLLSPSIQFNAGGPEMTIETVEASGITFPSPENISVGYTWTTRQVFTTTMGDMGAGEMQMYQTMEQANEIIAIEPVTTPYGSFEEAVKVQSTGTMDIVMSMSGVEMPPTTVKMSGASWYVKDVGRVRSEDLSDFFGTGEPTPTISELISIEMD